ncbi:multidrug transporter [Ursidibacter arcticus]|uniref:MBL fold metallo-hydrolase n=1 Tax=Ursidibacter arcticus TaxID=1524965 RepID=UPI0012F747DC|nr:MBL fold metallo-hydrolase [Ursidibacter arcticus]KAE9536275.1 multidrug transporter [Ursidibacter arcticus]
MKFTKKYLALFSLLLAGGYYFYPENYPIYVESDHYSVDKKQFFNPTLDKNVEKIAAFKAIWQMIFNAQAFTPPSLLPMNKPDFQAFLSESDNAKFIWFGHSSILARIANQTIFIDPVFAKSVSPIPIMMKRFQAPPATLAELPEVDLIIYSHNHYDHLDENVVRHYALQKTRFIVPLGMSVLLKKWGVSAERIEELDWWQSTQIGNLTLTAVPAKHNTGRGLFDSNKTLWAGYVFKTPQEQIYYSGDSAFGNGLHFKQIVERFGGFDLAFVENGQYNPAWIDNHMLPVQTAQAVTMLNAKRFMPVHWGAYPLSIHAWDEPVKESIPLVEKAGIKTLTPIMGDVFDKNTETSHWWLNVK